MGEYQDCLLCGISRFGLYSPTVCFLAQLRGIVCADDYCDLMDPSAMPDSLRRDPLAPFESEEIEWPFGVTDQTRFESTDLPLYWPGRINPKDNEHGPAGVIIYQQFSREHRLPTRFQLSAGEDGLCR